MAFCQPTVIGLLLFHVQDEPALGAWQSGEYYVDGTPKSSLGRRAPRRRRRPPRHRRAVPGPAADAEARRLGVDAGQDGREGHAHMLTRLLLHRLARPAAPAARHRRRPRRERRRSSRARSPPGQAPSSPRAPPPLVNAGPARVGSALVPFSSRCSHSRGCGVRRRTRAAELTRRRGRGRGEVGARRRAARCRLARDAGFRAIVAQRGLEAAARRRRATCRRSGAPSSAAVRERDRAVSSPSTSSARATPLDDGRAARVRRVRGGARPRAARRARRSSSATSRTSTSSGCRSSAPDGGDAAAAAYEQLLAETYDALKDVDADLTVVGGGLAPRGGDDPNASRQTHSPTHVHPRPRRAPTARAAATGR